MPIYNLILIICWAVFLIYWFFTSLHTKKNRNSSKEFWFARWVVAVIILVFFRHQVADIVAAFKIIPSSSATLGIVGDLFAIVGIGFAIWARKNLGANWGTPMTIKESPDLVTSGPYSYVRHPIYTGVLLAILGSVVVGTPGWIIVFLVSFVGFFYSARREEHDMIREFGEKYRSYMKRTKFLIPFVY
ncbi:MAG TPA: isoprenylcysteine carboxylmethyltransferase family protein [Patescibacteria group bacterium]|nr:isoprenylcysteine carboxylmethyltransferase family protein [Patescibacteria group bacterium]